MWSTDRRLILEPSRTATGGSFQATQPRFRTPGTTPGIPTQGVPWSRVASICAGTCRWRGVGASRGWARAAALPDGADPARKILLGPALSASEFHSRLGAMLIERGLVTREALKAALDEQERRGGLIGDVLVELGFVTHADLARVLADQLHMPFIELHDEIPDVTLLDVIPADVANRLTALPVTRWGDQIVVAMATPNLGDAVDELRRCIDGPVVIAVAEPAALRRLVDRAYVDQRGANANADCVPGAATQLMCPGCRAFLTLNGPPWILHEEHPEAGRYYVWDADPATSHPAHVCGGR